MTAILSPGKLSQAEHQAAARLSRHVSDSHQHIDWYSFEEWLRSPALFSRVIREYGQLRALMGATIHIPASHEPVAWLRFILPGAIRSNRDSSLDALWLALQADLRREGVAQVGLLTFQPWVGAIARRWGFNKRTTVVTLRRLQGPILPPDIPGLTIREAQAADLEAVARVDSAAFEPIWQYDADVLRFASRQPGRFSVAVTKGEIVGYLLSTSFLSSGHLARLAVLPPQQGKGIGTALIADMLRYFKAGGITNITVNTQQDNTASRHLYERFGFRLAGNGVPFWELSL